MKTSPANIQIGKYVLLLLAVFFFGISFVFNKLYTNRSSVTQEVKKVEQYLQHQANDFARFCKDTQLINKLLSKEESLHEFNHLANKAYGIFLYKVNEFGEQEMAFWSDKLVELPARMLPAPDGEYFDKLSNGYYYTIKNTLGASTRNNTIVAYAMVLVRRQFYIESGYLQSRFAYSSTADKRVIISNRITEFPVRISGGKTLFYLDKKAAGGVPYNDRLTIILRLGGLLFLFLFFHMVAEHTAERRGAWRSVGILTLLLLAMRLITYYYPSFLNLRQFELFDPGIYGSNPVQRSLGDLLFNAILFCWIILFAWSKLHNSQDLTERFGQKLKVITGAIALILLILSTFILASVIRSLISDSKISFDVTDFFSLNEFTVVGFVVLACLSLSYYYLSQLLFRLIFPLFDNRKIPIYFAIAITGLIYLTTRPGPDVLFYIPVLAWLLLYTLLISRQSAIFNRLRINIASVLSWIFVFSVSISVIMLTENNKAEWQKRKRLAEKIANQSDPTGTKIMSIAFNYLDNDFLINNFYRFYDEVKGKEFRDSIIAGNYSSYFNKYDTRLYVYDSANNALFNEDYTAYEAFTNILNVHAKPIDILKGLYYYETSFDKFNYITRREIIDTSGKKYGSFFIVSNPRNYIREAIFPEIFRQSKDSDPENSPIYSTATYVGGRLVSPPGNYPFATWLTAEEMPNAEFVQRTSGEFDELWYRANKERVIVIARKKENVLETITLFSYIFCAFLFLVAFVQLISLALKTIYDRTRLRRLFQLNIRTQVHSTIIFISIFSFLIIGVATISFFIKRFNRNNSDKLSRTMKIMVNEMENKLSDHTTFDDVVKLYDSVGSQALQRLVKEVSEIHGVDVNVYDLNGDLQVSSENDVYSKGVISRKIDPEAFYHLSRMRKVQHGQMERIANTSYFSIYSPVRDDKGKVYAYINIPFFTSKRELEQEISNFLVTIINLNAFIFLVAGLIALFITNRITRSFAVISDKMRDVNLGRHNDEITWSRNDEIGELVKEYNKMVTKLGESADALAKSEREGAWREMARQVAHEIKNPLTPMKLSIQYLQKAISNNQQNVKELSSNVANTLVEQIDHLSKIAADFSQFANIGYTSVEFFDLHDVMKSLKELYQADQSIELVWLPLREPVMINADKTQMNRLFTNLLTNAVQACRQTERCIIVIEEKKKEDKIVISVKDNGEGIPVEMQDRIFVPNFTTKSSGTGLGLAMCQGIVEQAHGRIWFETEQGRGSTFFVELPLAGDR